MNLLEFLTSCYLVEEGQLGTAVKIKKKVCNVGWGVNDTSPAEFYFQKKKKSYNKKIAYQVEKKKKKKKRKEKKELGP